MLSLVATDRDRFARVVDKRFNSTAFALANGAPNAVELAVKYAMMRGQEADPTLSSMFKEAHRVLVRESAAPRLLPDGDYEAERIRTRGLESQPAMRLAAAFDEARRYGGDLAETLAEHEYRWIRGSLRTLLDWPDARTPFEALETQFKEQLAAAHRLKHLGIGERPVRAPRPTQADIMSSTVSVTP
jgi:hypothetical protein